MPVLGGLIVSAFTALAEFFGIWLTRKVAAITSAVAVSGTLLVALGVGAQAAVAGIVAVAPADGWFLTGLYFGVPANGPACLAACITVDALCAAYRIGMQKVKLAVAA